MCGGFPGGVLLNSVSESFLQMPFTFCREISIQEKGLLYVFGFVEKKKMLVSTSALSEPRRLQALSTPLVCIL